MIDDEQDHSEQELVRREKLDRLKETGTDPYPVTVPRTATLAEVVGRYPDLPPDTATGDRVGVTGRVIFIRNTGKLCFATLREGGAGTELQAMLSLDRVGAESLAAWKARRRPRRPRRASPARSSPPAAASCPCWPTHGG